MQDHGHAKAFEGPRPGEAGTISKERTRSLVGSREVVDNKRLKLEPRGHPALLQGGQPCPRLTPLVPWARFPCRMERPGCPPRCLWTIWPASLTAIPCSPK